MRRPRSWILILIMGIGGAGCSTLRPAPPSRPHLTGQKILPVDFIPQRPQECGPTVLRMATAHLRPEVDFDLYRRMSFREEAQGSFKSDLLSATRRLGLVPYRIRKSEDLFRQIEAGHPVIVYQNLGLEWLPAGHYSLLVGYSAGPDRVYLHSDQKAQQSMDFERFTSTWERGGSWAFVALPANELPNPVDFDEALENAMVFERLGDNDIAETLYHKILKRWPDRFEPHIGLTHLYERNGQSQKALESARQGLAKSPEHPDLLYNAAFLYFRNGDITQARRLQGRALFFASPESRERYTNF